MWTIPAPRGCGTRTKGGIYLVSGGGTASIYDLLRDPPDDLPAGIDLANKSLVWHRLDRQGNEVIHSQTGQPIYDVYMHVGSNNYPSLVDFVEEANCLGVSRKIPPSLDLKKLSLGSCMIFSHSRTLPNNWRELLPPRECRKNRAGHTELDPEERPGFCTFKHWELLEGEPHITVRRTIGSITYPHTPSGDLERVSGWQEKIFLIVAISGVELPRDDDGSGNEKAKQKLTEARDWQGNYALPFEETDE